MKTIILDGQIKNAVKAEFEKLINLKRSLNILANEVGSQQRFLWDIVADAHPETKGKKCIFNKESPDIITVVENEFMEALYHLECAKNAAIGSQEFELSSAIRELINSARKD